MRRWLLILLIAPSAPLRGQTPSDQKPLAFDVASIKLNSSAEERVAGGFLQGGRYRVTNYSLRSLIAAAYLRPQVTPDFLIAGGPDWIDTARFDIDAKAATDFSPAPDGPSAPRRVMLQRLLADRFALRVHTTTSERPVYALVMARADRRMGPQWHVAQGQCASRERATSCAARIGPGAVTLKGTTVAQLVNLLSRFVNRVVVDRTLLTGAFDVELRWTPAPGEWVAPGQDAPSADGPSLFTALQEQLGLKLEATKGPVDVLVIDHVEKPTLD